MRIVLPRYCVQSPPSIEQMQSSILELYKIVYTDYFNQRTLLKNNSLIEIRYENFLKNTYNETERIYETLELNNFDSSKNVIKKYINSQQSFITSKYEMSEDLKHKIRNELSFIFEEFQYSK